MFKNEKLSIPKQQNEIPIGELNKIVKDRFISKCSKNCLSYLFFF